MKIPVGDAKVFRARVAKHFAGRVGKLPTAADVVNEVRGLFKQMQLTIPEEKAGMPVNQAAFDAEVDRLADGRELGFVGKHHNVIMRIRDLVARIKDQEKRLEELQAQEAEATTQLKEREKQAAATAAKLIAAREQTLRLADELRQLQETLFRAQVELANADRDNQILARYLRDLELKRGGKK